MRIYYIVCFTLILALANINMELYAEPFPRGTLLPSYSAAVSDDAMSTIINPAALGIVRGSSCYYFHTFSGETGGDNAFFMSLSGFGFGAEFSNPGPAKFAKYTLSNGTRIFNNLYMGSSYSRFSSDDDDYDRLSSWDMGFLYRPSDLLSIGMVARNLHRPMFANVRTYREYDLAFAFRPYTNRLTFSVDAVFQEGKSVRDGKIAYAVECEPTDGITIRGSYNNDGDFDMRIGVGLPQIGVGEYSRFDSDWNHSGGAAYLRFSSEQRRARLQKRGRNFHIYATAKSNAGLKPDEKADILALPRRAPIWCRLIS